MVFFQKNLGELLESLSSFQIFGNKDLSILGISDDSRKAKPGEIFVAIKGFHFDAHKFIAEVIKKGVKVVVGEESPKKSWIKKATYIKVKNSRAALAFLSSAWYDYPARNLKVIGVTGTDGKTTTATLIYSILETAGKKVGLISTVSAKIGKKEYDTGFHVTNPEPLALQGFLKKMAEEGLEYAVLEVTSHGLDQERVAGINFEVGVLTNISHEHLDYHKTYTNYLKAKAKLFLNSKIAVLNKDDVSFGEVKNLLPGNVKFLSYSLKNLKGKIKKAVISKFPQRYNQENAAAAITVAKYFKVSEKDIIQAIKAFPGICGRMEEIKNQKGIKVIVDFAHTPNALKNVLSFLKEKTKGKLICVFGCAGERDFEKRPMMGEIAASLAEITVLTAEDPRTEDVNQIIDQISIGCKKVGAKELSPFCLNDLNHLNKKHYFFRVPDRKKAIEFVIQKLAKEKDVVVICGKGHERSMCFGKTEYPWSDQKVASRAIMNK
jgi:UDP-N-acetylmuramoyl-L-alanyl-D-glutamate--2,6-diaminopimelate ligase